MSFARERRIASTWLLVIGGFVVPTAVAAQTECLDPAAFNDRMQTQNLMVSDLTVTFSVSGIAPTSFGKGYLVSLGDTRCEIGWSAVDMKIYGTEGQSGSSHPQGSIKQEHNTRCQWLHQGGEHAATTDQIVFTDPSQSFSVTVWLDPTEFGYRVEDAAGPVYQKPEPNAEGMKINRVSLLSQIGGGFPTGGVASGAQICFEPAEAATLYAAFPALDDATVTAAAPDSADPDGDRLGIALDQSESFLQFDVDGIDGRVLRAWTFFFTPNDAVAGGGPVDIFSTASSSWTEATLTWNTRPAVDGPALDSINAFVPDRSFAFDVTEAVQEDGRYAFALVAGSGSTDDVWLFSSEGAVRFVDPPMLLVEYVQIDQDEDGYFDGPDCDDLDPDIHPAADERCDNGEDDDCDGEVDEGCGCSPSDEICNGVDDDCDGDVDEGCEPAPPADGPADAAEANTGCGCEGAGRAARGWVGALLAGLLLCRRRRRSGRGRRAQESG